MLTLFLSKIVHDIPHGNCVLKKVCSLLCFYCVFFLLCLVVILLSGCPGFVRGERVDILNVKSNQTAPDGSSVARMWSEWNEGTRS